MVWQLTVRGSEAEVHAAAERLGFLEAGEALAVTVLYSGDRPAAEALYETEADARAAQGEVGGDVAPVADRDWVSETQSGLHPVKAGRFLLHGSHDAPDAGALIPIVVDAGLAFGTGHHGTTEGCLRLFSGRLDAGAKYGRVLDLGTGSGVLAIAAAKALGIVVDASDIDADAVEVTRANAEANGVGELVNVWQADGLSDPRFGAYDLVFANILARPLMGMAGDIARVAEGDVILSGILDEQAEEVTGVFAGVGLRETDRVSLEGWTSLVVRAE